MNTAAFSVRKPVLAHLVTAVLVVAGLYFGFNLRMEFFPEVRPNQVRILAPYPGAAPDEVEQSLAKKIEDRIVELDEVEEINTTVVEGMCTVFVEFGDGVDIREAVADVKREMDALQDLPEEAERIVVDKWEPNIPTINISLFGDADERSMKEALRQIREDLRGLKGMGDIVESGTRTDELVVEVRPAALLEHGLSLPMVAQAIRGAMIELPSGAVRSATQNTSIRVMGALETAEDVRQIVVKGGVDSPVLRLGEIATVRQGYADVDLVTRESGKPCVSLTIYKVGEKDAVDMADLVKAYAAGRKREPLKLTFGERLASILPAGPAGGANAPAVDDAAPGTEPLPDGCAEAVAGRTPVSERLRAYQLGLSRSPPPGELVVTTDLARFIVGRLNLLLDNAGQGAVLLLLGLAVFLNFRVAFWVFFGLLVAMVTTFAVMYFTGTTLNLLSMFGLILVLGIQCDDAVVVSENIIARHEKGEAPDVAAIRGTRQVAAPVTATVITTVVAFFPLAMIDGQLGDMLGILPMIALCALGSSLFDSLFLLPGHISHSLERLDRERASGKAGLYRRFEARADALRERLLQGALVPAYERLLRLCLKSRYLTLACCFSAVLVSIAMVAGGRLGYTFLTSSDSETVNIELRMPVGTPLAQTDEVIRKIEAAATAQPEITSVWAQVGGFASLDGDQSSQQTHLGQVILELTPVESRERSSEQVNQSIRDLLGELPGVERLRMEEVSGGPGGPGITLTVVGATVERMMPVVDELKSLLRAYNGVFDVADDADLGRRELRVELLDGAQEHGFTTDSIATQVRGAVFGIEAHTFAGDREDVDVRVMFPERERRSLASIESMYVLSNTGVFAPLREVSRVREEAGYASIRRLDRERAVTVTASVNRSVANPEEVTRTLADELNRIRAAHPGIRILERGRQKEQMESMASLPLGLLAAMGMVFVILVWLFESYTQPLLVLTAIPFGTVGMVWGHMLLGYELTFLSLIGFVALSGVVVNDSLVFVEFYNQLRAEGGRSHFEALIETGRLRIRPILLTTVTTVFGLLPLTLEQSFQAKFLIPMAITLSAGLTAATVSTLIALPAMILALDDIRHGLHWLWYGPGGPPEREHTPGRQAVAAGSAPAPAVLEPDGGG